MALCYRPRSRSRLALYVVVGLVISVLDPARGRAQIAPNEISFQGLLTSPGGTPTNATVSITFKLYKGAIAVWTETQPTVVVSNGIFNVQLGIVTPLDTVAFDRPINLGIKVGTDPEISPRTPLTSAAFALGIRGMYAVWAENDGRSGFNLVGGYDLNAAGPGAVGVTIHGGGVEPPFASPNIVSEDWGTIGGGIANTIDGYGGVIGGGRFNTVTGELGTISGGYFNRAGPFGAVPGGLFNRALMDRTFAAGVNAIAKHSGAFVWNSDAGESGLDSLVSTGSNQFLIGAAGGVGIGTASPEARLDVLGGQWDLSASDGDVRIGAGAERLKIGVATGGGGAGIARLNATGTTPWLVLGSNNVDIVYVTPTNFNPWGDNVTKLGDTGKRWTAVYAVNGTIQTSDARMKEDVHPVRYGLSTVLDLRPVSYRWRDRPGDGARLGLIAQDVAEVVPEVVHHGATPEAMLGINYSELVPVLIAAIQELTAKVAALEARAPKL